VNHVGFLVKNLIEVFDKWQAAGVKVERRGTAGRGADVTTPDRVRIEITEDASINVPIKMHHVHFFLGSPLETQAWYAKTFGAVPGKRGNDIAGDLPGVNLTFRKVDPAPAGTKGRTIDHIGFEVKNLEQFCKKLEAAGVKLDRPYTRLPNSNVAVAFVTDPWGTYVELTENLAPAN
jgi:catechol 2,3-dioxygenase-like lactoylglutathione lyase family enzyme